MDEGANPILPPPQAMRLAVMLFIGRAYGGASPPGVGRFLPPDNFDVAAWLMSDLVERDPASAPLGAVRSFALRIGNLQYPHMKLRLSCLPRDSVFLFSVDSHDAFLQASPGTPDFQMLEELKKHNAIVAADISAAWEQAGLATERNYLRRKIQQARQSQQG